MTKTIRLTTAQALELAGLPVHAYGSVEAARRSVGPNAPIVLLCDVNLPGMHATDWLPEVRAVDADLPMILVTGHGDIAMAVSRARGLALSGTAIEVECDTLEQVDAAIAAGAANEVLPLQRIAPALIERLKSTVGAAIHRV